MLRRILIFIAVLAVPLTLIAVSALPARADESPPTLSPAQGPPGTTVTASATDWSGCSSMSVSGWGTTLGTTSIDSSGAFSLSFRVPSNAPLGATQLQFDPTCSHSTYIPFVTFTVTQGTPPPSSCPAPSVSFTPAAGPVATTFTITGNNWVPRGTVTSTLPYGSPGWFTGYQTPTVDANGGFSFKETVSTGPGGPTPPGKYSFTYVEKYGGCSLSFKQTFTVTGGDACVFSAPSGAFGLAGHVAWGFELTNGTWEFGANEGPYYWPLRKADISKTWYKTGSFSVMLTTFRQGGPYNGPNYYTTYKCQKVSIPDAGSAATEVRHESHQYYAIPGQDCLSQVYNVLNKYGATGLPNDILDPVPNTWYKYLSGFSGPTRL